MIVTMDNNDNTTHLSITAKDIEVTPFALICNKCHMGIALHDINNTDRTLDSMLTCGLKYHCSTETHCVSCGITEFENDYITKPELYKKEFKTILGKIDNDIKSLALIAKLYKDGGKQYFCNNYLKDDNYWNEKEESKKGPRIKGWNLKKGEYKYCQFYENTPIEEFKENHCKYNYYWKMFCDEIAKSPAHYNNLPCDSYNNKENVLLPTILVTANGSIKEQGSRVIGSIIQHSAMNVTGSNENTKKLCVIKGGIKDMNISKNVQHCNVTKVKRPSINYYAQNAQNSKPLLNRVTGSNVITKKQCVIKGGIKQQFDDIMFKEIYNTNSNVFTKKQCVIKGGINQQFDDIMFKEIYNTNKIQNCNKIIVKRPSNNCYSKIGKPLFCDLSMSESETKKIEDVMNGSITHQDEAIIVNAKDAVDSVKFISFKTLQPGEELNDEVIDYFFYLLQKRDAHLCCKR
jgi:hypothetical protein